MDRHKKVAGVSDDDGGGGGRSSPLYLSRRQLAALRRQRLEHWKISLWQYVTVPLLRKDPARRAKASLTVYLRDECTRHRVHSKPKTTKEPGVLRLRLPQLTP